MEIKSGDVITYKDGSKRVFGKIKINLEKAGIIKVERPTQYETVFERKEEILDEAEKRYLSNVIRPFRDKVRYIEKEDNGKISRIKICFDYHFMFFPILEKERRMYEGMQSNRAYSIKELGV